MSLPSSRRRDTRIIEKTALSDCRFLPGYWRASTDSPWTRQQQASLSASVLLDERNEDDVAGTALETSMIVVLAPAAHRRGPAGKNGSAQPYVRWDKETNFHPDLKADDRDGLVLQFRAKSRDSILVLLSSTPYYDKRGGPVKYEIILGGAGNTATFIRRLSKPEGSNRLEKSSSEVAIPPQRRRMGSSLSTPSRVCRDDTWVPYWVCLCRGNVYVGVGSVPGKDCIGILVDDTACEEQEERQGSEDQEGDSNTEQQDVGDEGGNNVAVDDVHRTTPNGTDDDNQGVVEADDSASLKEVPAPVQYVGIANGSKHVLQIQHLLLTNLPPLLERALSELPSQDDLDVVVVPSPNDNDTIDAETAEWKQLMEEYKKECQTRKARAAKYGMEYSEPPPDAFLPWSKVKRLRTNPEKGFITGLDLTDPKEVAKREARMARFAVAATTGADNNDDTGDGSRHGEGDDGEAEVSASAEGRLDTALGASRSSMQELSVVQAWDKEEMIRPLRTDPPKYLWKVDSDPQGDDGTSKTPIGGEEMEESNPFAMEKPKLATFVPEKVHLCAIDWAAFKQIRNNDIMAHFSGYGPSYVEWLGDLSCNVCFEDRYTASRALLNLSNEIPSPPPPEAHERASREEDGNDGNGVTKSETLQDLGRMTWRFGKQAIRKVANDRHGRRGTTARILMRVATSKDTLEERPHSWPAPPGGFSSTKVLGPDSDNPPNKQRQNEQPHIRQQRGGRSQKSKRQRENAESKDRQKDQPRQHESAESLVNRGLSSGRGGFTVEEMEKERAKKRQKKTEP